VSQHNLHVIPDEPAWVPDEMAARRAVRVLRSLLPGSRAVHAQVHPHPVFVDGSQLFERVACPACGSEIARSWWSERMSRADRSEFTRLAVRTPCCDTATSLTDLAYAGPAGFARFQLTVELPDRDDLTDAELAEVAGALGHPVRAVPERA
jgi:hypothetical protein